MTISSRTPEGSPNRCPVCGADFRTEPSRPPGDAPCPQCGHLLWFGPAPAQYPPGVTPLGPAWAVDLGRFLPPPGDPLRAAVLQEVITIDLQFRWQCGQAVLLERYLELF